MFVVTLTPDAQLVSSAFPVLETGCDKKCLFDGEMKKANVDEVVVVGGSTRIPKIQRMVEEFFDGKRLCKSLNGDKAVASGAAILAARLSGNYENMKSDIVLQDVTPLSLGIAVSNNVNDCMMSVVIPRNSFIPTSKKRIYQSKVNSPGVNISVYQGESIKVNDNVLLGKFNLLDLMLGPHGYSEIEVLFSIDVNGILFVSAQELSTGKIKSITITKT